MILASGLKVCTCLLICTVGAVVSALLSLLRAYLWWKMRWDVSIINCCATVSLLHFFPLFPQNYSLGSMTFWVASSTRGGILHSTFQMVLWIYSTGLSVHILTLGCLDEMYFCSWVLKQFYFVSPSPESSSWNRSFILWSLSLHHLEPDSYAALNKWLINCDRELKDWRVKGIKENF